jgi:hypothetical protein
MAAANLARDYERRPEHHEAMVCWATIFIMTRRLTRYENSQPLLASPHSGATGSRRRVRADGAAPGRSAVS